MRHRVLGFMKKSHWHRYMVGVGTVFVTLLTVYIGLALVVTAPRLLEQVRSDDAYFVYKDIEVVQAKVGEPLRFFSDIDIKADGLFHYNDTLKCSNGEDVFINYISETPAIKNPYKHSVWTFKALTSDSGLMDFVPLHEQSCELRSQITLILPSGVEKNQFVLTEFNISPKDK